MSQMKPSSLENIARREKYSLCRHIPSQYRIAKLKELAPHMTAEEIGRLSNREIDIIVQSLQTKAMKKLKEESDNG